MSKLVAHRVEWMTFWGYPNLYFPLSHMLKSLNFTQQLAVAFHLAWRGRMWHQLSHRSYKHLRKVSSLSIISVHVEMVAKYSNALRKFFNRCSIKMHKHKSQRYYNWRSPERDWIHLVTTQISLREETNHHRWRAHECSAGRSFAVSHEKASGAQQKNSTCIE